MIKYLDNALTAFIVLTLFIALCYAANPYQPTGYSQADRQAMNKLVQRELTPHKMTPHEQAVAIIDIYGREVK